jgi:bifunctional UDP-N-acetylglucosamine pyrophosphorylase/glucosamine-1-phosphate N-acetyltransferase
MKRSELDREHSQTGTFVAIVLAAGQGTRMKASLPKVAHTVLGRPLLLWPLHALVQAGVHQTAVVLSPQHPTVEQVVRRFAEVGAGSVRVCYQNEPRGTGHAAMAGLTCWSGPNLRADQPDHILVTMGDAPLVRSDTFSSFMNSHASSGAAVSILAFTAGNPAGYGRVVQDKDGQFLQIKEEKDCTDLERQVRLCHSGILALRMSDAERLLSLVDADNAAGEYYLTAVAGIAQQQGLGVHVFSGVAEDEVAGVNTQSQLAAAAAILQRRILEDWMARGVHFEAPQSVHVDVDVRLGSDVVIEPFVCLRSGCVIPDGTRVRTGFGLIPA